MPGQRGCLLPWLLAVVWLSAANGLSPQQGEQKCEQSGFGDSACRAEADCAWEDGQCWYSPGGGGDRGPSGSREPSPPGPSDGGNGEPLDCYSQMRSRSLECGGGSMLRPSHEPGTGLSHHGLISECCESSGGPSGSPGPSPPDYVSGAPWPRAARASLLAPPPPLRRF